MSESSTTRYSITQTVPHKTQKSSRLSAETVPPVLLISLLIVSQYNKPHVHLTCIIGPNFLCGSSHLLARSDVLPFLHPTRTSHKPPIQISQRP